MPNNKKRPGLGHNRPPKTAKQRAKDYEKAQRAAGWRKVWVDPATLGLIKDLGGKSPALFARHAQLERDTQEQAEKIKELQQNTKQLVELNTTFIEVTSAQAKAKDQQIEKLEQIARERADKNAELERIAQNRADLIDNQKDALDKLRNDLEAERNRTLLDRLMSSLLRK